MSRRLDNDELHQPSSSSPQPPSLSLSDEISSVHRTLHLLYHHNKNQHRCTKWWKWLSILKRWCLKLACEAETVDKDEDYDETENASAKMLMIMKHLRNEVIQRCYHAFSTVVADPPFSPLGIVLIGTLARLVKIVNANCPQEGVAQQVVDERVVTGPERSTNTIPREDLGELISRSDIVATGAEEKVDIEMAVSVDTTVKKTKRTQEVVVDTPKGMKRQRAEQEKKVKKKSKKRKGNAIDDIFGDLF